MSIVLTVLRAIGLLLFIVAFPFLFAPICLYVLATPPPRKPRWQDRGHRA